MDYFANKVVLITGASSGIGAELARALSKRGAIIGLTARRSEMLDAVKREIESDGGIARAFVCDVTDREVLYKAAQAMRDEFGAIDIMVANAGIGGKTDENNCHNPDAIGNVININLLGAVNSVGAVLPAMVERGKGQLVAISSLAGIRGLPRSGAYSASKAGMTAFFESVRLDMLGKGIDVTIIQPGFIKTPLTSVRTNRMPFLMELNDAIPLFMRAIERKTRFASFPWQLAWVVRSAKIFPGWIYDRMAVGARYRE